ncbi:hypothetical protein GBA52_024747 [Prunus armeniaca]|nr:hypothetical protein GBA52_024747 [Prunus armeniaca]
MEQIPIKITLLFLGLKLSDKTVSQTKENTALLCSSGCRTLQSLKFSISPAILSPPFSISPQIQFSKNVAVSFEKSWHGNLLPFQSFDGCPRTLSSFSFTGTLLRFDSFWVKFFISIDNLNRVGEEEEPELETGVPFGLLSSLPSGFASSFTSLYAASSEYQVTSGTLQTCHGQGCIPFIGGCSTSSSAYQRHFSHSSPIWRFKLGSFDKCGQLPPFASQSLLRIQRPYSAQAITQQKSRKMLLYLTGLVFAMVASSYAAVPLYRRFCQATGYGGTVQRRESVEQKIARHAKDGTVTTREIVVQFNADVADGMQWKFIPTQREVRVKPGESALAFYTAENRSSTPIVGVSTYNVTPMKAAVYFNKIQCFCFEEQRLLPGEQIDMPVFFYIDPEFETDPRMDGINNIILSYTFFKVSEE